MKTTPSFLVKFLTAKRNEEEEKQDGDDFCAHGFLASSCKVISYYFIYKSQITSFLGKK